MQKGGDRRHTTEFQQNLISNDISKIKATVNIYPPITQPSILKVNTHREEYIYLHLEGLQKNKASGSCNIQMLSYFHRYDP